MSAVQPKRVETSRADEVISAMIHWSETTLEQPNPVFGDLPICPFARAARLREAIQFHVIPFEVDDPLEDGGWLMPLIEDYVAEARAETLFVIHPDPAAMEARALEAFVLRLGQRFRAIPPLADLRVFEAHPHSPFCVGGVYTRRSPYPSFQVLTHTQLKETSDTLLKSGYYEHFTPEMLRAVGMPRS